MKRPAAACKAHLENGAELEIGTNCSKYYERQTASEIYYEKVVLGLDSRPEFNESLYKIALENEQLPDDDSNKLKTPGTSLKQVKDVVNKGAKSADPTPASDVPEKTAPWSPGSCPLRAVEVEIRFPAF